MNKYIYVQWNHPHSHELHGMFGYDLNGLGNYIYIRSRPILSHHQSVLIHRNIQYSGKLTVTYG